MAVFRFSTVRPRNPQTTIPKRRITTKSATLIVIVGLGIFCHESEAQPPRKPQSGAPSQENRKRAGEGIPNKNVPAAQNKGTPQKALNIFADAANFQNNGAFELAIAEWKKLIKDYPKDPILSKAHHYLGVCYLRISPPKYEEAVKAFEQAIRDSSLDVREESLFNLGWSLYALGRDADGAKKQSLLTQSLETLQVYMKGYADGSVADRALFYSAECEYLLGRGGKASALYKQLLNGTAYSKSPIRPDALYALGVNAEEQKDEVLARDSFDEFLKVYSEHKLSSDVKLRRAEIAIKGGDTELGATLLKQIIGSKEIANQDYVLYRYGFALAKLGRFDESSAIYKRIAEEFPQSQYLGAGILAAGQTLMRERRFEEASQYFKKLLDAKDDKAAEAAHWLCQIGILSGKPASAIPIAREALSWGAAKPSAPALKMDLADALMDSADGRAEARSLFESIATDHPSDPLAPRATYNAAFAALQMGDPQEAKRWASEFMKRFRNDSLADDAAYVLAESTLQLGEHDAAIESFKRLVQVKKDDPDLGTYQLRLATARFLKGALDDVLQQLKEPSSEFKIAAQQAEGYFLIGAAKMRKGLPKEAIESFQKSIQLAPKWSNADETLLMLSQAYQIDENRSKAIQTLERLIQEFPSGRFRYQAEFRLGQLAVGGGEFDRAIAIYNKILEAPNSPLIPDFVKHAKAFAYYQKKSFQEAIALVEPIASSDRDDNLGFESRMLLAICQRQTEKVDDSIKTLRGMLDRKPEGNALGNVLYELGLSYAQKGEHEKAKASFQRIRDEVPNFPAMDKVLIELAYSLKELDQAENSQRFFREVTEKYPNSIYVGEANFHLGQNHYSSEKYDLAVKAYTASYTKSTDANVQEKALHKLGWSLFKLKDYAKASEYFAKQIESFPKGEFHVDGAFMQAQCVFKLEKYSEAFPLYRTAKEALESLNDPGEISENIQTLIYLQGAQSARELKQWDTVEAWLNIAVKKFPESPYHPEVLFELANCYQNQQKTEKSLELFGEVANNYRNEIAARSRFMMGEVYFAQKEFSKAIPEFQRVMFGFGGQQAAVPIKNWQARSAFEAGRCAELLIGDLKGERRSKAIGIAKDFYQYVLDHHGEHELSEQSKGRVAALDKM